MKQKKEKEAKSQPKKPSKLLQAVEKATQRNQSFFRDVEQLEVIPKTYEFVKEEVQVEIVLYGQIGQERIELEEKPKDQRLVSVRWLLTLKPNIQSDLDIVYQEDTEIEDIVKFQLRERVARQKEAQRQQYFGLLQELQLEQKHQTWDEKVKEDFHCHYQYQAADKVVSLDIKYFDFLKLNPQNYVNDTIINFFLRFVENEIFRDPNLLIFNTYFSAKLVPQSGELSSIFKEYQQHHRTLSKWNKGDLLGKKLLLFPLHLKEHWAALFVVEPEALCAQLAGRAGENKGMLLYFDSLQLFDMRIAFTVKCFLLHAWSATRQALSSDQIYQMAQTQVAAHQPIVPRQTNLVDCGLYMLEYVERFLADPHHILGRLDQDHLNWFPKVTIFIKRILIKKILYGLSQGQKDCAERYVLNCKQIDQNYNKPEQFDRIDDSLLEQFQVTRLQFYLSEEYNFYYEGD